MRNNFPGKILLCVFMVVTTQHAYPSDATPLHSKFDPQEISWVKKRGNASIEGEAYIRLEDGTYKGCSGFNVELLPVAEYSNERIFRTYGNNVAGQILIKESPPTFTPDFKEYHDLVIKTKCNANNKFSFTNVYPGHYYVMAFIIWNGTEGGGVMKKVTLANGHEETTVLRVE